ncbi:hypothetical protein [Roseovarius sp. M141]|uniref:hypothetical protein n=1 Tax=Roseovarius sp. M141 TaxID=2583806 RepID=UPI0020CECA92|nr:hypothetical protein [Roseovarius sp. M141]MCQ0092978.1 hypothetical protein [Roseovarius sp. M141]
MFFLLILTTNVRDIRPTSMLHDARMAAVRKLQRRIGAIGERQLRAVRAGHAAATSEVNNAIFAAIDRKTYVIET